MGLVSCKSWLLWLISVYCILQVSSAHFPYDLDYQHRISLDCESVKVNSNNTHAYFSFDSFDKNNAGQAAVTYFNAKDWECALGSLGIMWPHSAFSSSFNAGRFIMSAYIPQEKRHELTGSFVCNKTSVTNDVISFNETSYKDNSLKINDSGVYCFVMRPLTSLGYNIGSYVYYSDYNYTDFTGRESSFLSDLDFTPLIFTALLFLPACIWIYLLRSQPAKVLPIQYGLLVYIVAIAIGITVDVCDEELYNGINYPIELFIRCLLLFLASFGIGVWRPVQFVQSKFLFMAIGGFSILLFFNIFSTVIGFIPLLVFSQWLNGSVSNVICLASIFVLYKERNQVDFKSECSAKVCKRSLTYCIVVFALRPMFISTSYYNTYYLRQYGFVYWLLRYIVEIIIPCYIWYPSQNEQLVYTTSIEI
ncbi:uncharacterized protein SOCG_01246 [Schizosaccharomyces octosporus yFS286]|uniref:Uncharacterized protein n=1 Tax=Schizosaccharomyces octosporus (strain yFS286) TaxID=483514 RepID=S9QXL1_SCHOY|nr:uncharacterized protein SOCG_01246 [Schizosaccharomyces octosporus yFS286]EPX71025.1 hypothetical protein SOCG_01246 [Schizosaccharomyces octosporus yFS286]